MEIKRASRAKRTWFWLTCWRPITKYEYGKLWEFLMKFGMAVEKDHRKYNGDIAALKAKVGINDTNREKENTERGMYL